MMQSSIYRTVEINMVTVVSKKKTGRQNQTLAQWKILHCKTHDGAAGVFEIKQVF
jgi:hypothetical protein